MTTAKKAAERLGKPSRMFAGPGGRAMDKTYAAENLRADVSELVATYCLAHAARIADALLSRYDLVARPRGGNPRVLD